jgi:hypothetical protein
MSDLVGPLDQRWLAQFYEEGTWTPTLAGSTTAGSFTYSVQTGDYVRIGNTCFVRGRVRITGIGAAPVGDLRINGLPFTSVAIGASGNAGGGAFQLWQGITLPAGYTQLMWYVNQPVSYLNISRGGSNAAQANVQGGELVLVGGVANFELEGQYRVA